MNDERRLPTALCVSPTFGRRQPWRSWLQAEGFATATCAGYDVSDDCPRLAGRACPLREWADVVVIDGDQDTIYELSRGRQIVCSRIRDDGRTVVIQSDPPGGFGQRALVVQGPNGRDDVVAAVRDVLAERVALPA